MDRKAYTLLELMLTIAILTIFALLAYVLFGSIMRKAQEASTKGNLGTLRSALSIYFGQTEGRQPTDDLTSLIQMHLLKEIPMKYTPPYHPPGNTVGANTQMGHNNSDWFYFYDPKVSEFGEINVNCNHKDLRGVIWSSE